MSLLLLKSTTLVLSLLNQALKDHRNLKYSSSNVHICYNLQKSFQALDLEQLVGKYSKVNLTQFEPRL